MISSLETGSSSRHLHKRRLTRSDGRALLLYAWEPIDPGIVPPPVFDPPFAGANPHLRWHPLRGEWVAYAGHRQNRTFFPPAGYNPLARTDTATSPTELPAGRYDVAVFENKFPALVHDAHDPPEAIVPTRPAQGACEVVVFTDDAKASLGSLSLDRIEMILEVWADRTRDLGARSDVEYVFPFENRGVEVGVTLPHPHGQIYAYPFVPPTAARELEHQRAYYDRFGSGLLADHLAAELRDGRRIVFESLHALAFVPVCARYAYEVWVAPCRGAPSLVDLRAAERRDFARALKTTLLKLDGLWKTPMPYVLAFHQAPTDGRPHPEAHVHAQLYPALRMPSRLKYLAGSEIGAGVFTADTLPEDKAEELRRVEIGL
jgi:UDPglucose--hexose-1-phosphate uridylyltransferase